VVIIVIVNRACFGSPTSVSTLLCSQSGFANISTIMTYFDFVVFIGAGAMPVVRGKSVDCGSR